MTQEELKTCLGQLLVDLRMNWGYNYSDRLHEVLMLCDRIVEDTSQIENLVYSELQGDYDGRVFRNSEMYGYLSEDGITKEVRSYLKQNLTHPEYCEIFD